LQHQRVTADVLKKSEEPLPGKGVNREVQRGAERRTSQGVQSERFCPLNRKRTIPPKGELNNKRDGESAEYRRERESGRSWRALQRKNVSENRKGREKWTNDDKPGHKESGHSDIPGGFCVARGEEGSRIEERLQ